MVGRSYRRPLTANRGIDRMGACLRAASIRRGRERRTVDLRCSRASPKRENLDQVRAEALRRDIPATDVERWLGLARPSALLTQRGDGPVVGAIRGPVMLPADAEDPKFPLIATIDCAALPADVTDLPLPADGQLLLFGWPEEHGYGQVMYVPAGVAVEEREQYPPGFSPDDEECAEVYAEIPKGDLHLTVDISLPYVKTIPGPPWSPPLPGDPPFEEMTEVWQEVLGNVPEGTFSYGGLDNAAAVGRLRH